MEGQLLFNKRYSASDTNRSKLKKLLLLSNEQRLGVKGWENFLIFASPEEI